MTEKRKIVTEEEIERAVNVDISQVAESLGIRLTEHKKYWQSVENESLRFYKDTNIFNWYSQNKSGNTINLVREWTDKSFVDAVLFLNDPQLREVDVMSHIEEQEDFTYYFKHDESFEEVRDYLVNERQIQPSLVNLLHQKGFIRQDIYKQAIFAWSESGQVAGADVQGTVYDEERFGERGRFKGIAKNSESDFGFNVSLGTPDKLYVFESPVDLMSYWSMNLEMEDAMLVSMSGVKQQAVWKFMNYMHDAKNALPTKGVYLCVDNDRAGQQFFQQFENQVYEIKGTQNEEIRFYNGIPDDLAVPQKLVNLYEEVLEEMGSELDWKKLAAVHKVETNLSTTDRIANIEEYGKFFGRQQPLNEKSQELSDEELKNAITKLVATFEKTKNREGYSFKEVMKLEGVDALVLDKVVSRAEKQYDKYENKGCRPVRSVMKDWNDKLVDRNVSHVEKQLLQSFFVNDEQKLEIEKENGKLKANIKEDGRGVIGFFEADSPEEMEFLIKNYGFQALDKEDRRKYNHESVANTPQRPAPSAEIGMER